MKKIIYILSFLLVLSSGSYAQDPGETKLRAKMIEYIQKRLSLNKQEAERFAPIFIEYFRELRQTNQQYKGKGLELQQKIVELRLRYREQFKPVIGEKRSNDVFVYERDFIEEVKNIRKERIQDRREGRADKLKPEL